MASDTLDYDSDYKERPRPPKDGVPGFQFNPDTGLPYLTVLACTSLLAAALATCAGERRQNCEE